MIHKIALFFLLLTALPAAPARASGPEEVLRSTAASLRAKDVAAFRKMVDVASLFDVEFAAGYKGGEDVPFMPFRGQAVDAFLEKVASGEFARECAQAFRPGCPWYPDGLDRAVVTQTDASSAIAAIDSAKDIRTWLVLHRIDGQWRIVAAPGRYLLAESYAVDAFQETMRVYREALERSWKKRAEREARRAEEAVKAAEKAARLLAAVTVSDIAFAVEETEWSPRLIVTAVAGNGHTEPVRLSALELAITGGGEPVTVKKFSISTRYIEPGESLAFTFDTSVRGESEYAMARKLANGVCRAAGRVTSMLVGTRNLRIDETGGGLLSLP